jgi:hypothetical protein
MDVFTMVAVIVVVSCTAGVLNNYIQAKKKQRNDEADSSLAEELDELRERIEVLEKIVTDEKYHLHRELNELERQA